MIAAAFPQTRALPPGRQAQSSAFFRLQGLISLYSFVTIHKASAAANALLLSALTMAGASPTSWNIGISSSGRVDPETLFSGTSIWRAERSLIVGAATETSPPRDAKNTYGALHGLSLLSPSALL